MPTTTRGFLGRRRAERDPRLPPGQYDARDSWPVLHAEATPRRMAPERWTFMIEGLVENEVSWTWDEIHALPRSRYAGDIHCVTTWSKLGMTFDGVSMDTLLEAAEPLPTATHVVATSHTGYTTNLPLADITGGKAWVVWDADGSPLTLEHGGPARLLVPHLYFWKSAKWVSGLRVLDHDEPGFWERNGYHDRGDPWKEQRYQGD
jgi:DMSO/TMAO reductase YedYZ molybdopterin-dependent catalytic subunit